MKKFEIKAIDQKSVLFGDDDDGLDWYVVYEGEIIIGDYHKTFKMYPYLWKLEDYQQQWIDGIERLKTHDTSCLVQSISVTHTGYASMDVWKLYKVGDTVFINRQALMESKKIKLGKRPHFSQSCYDLIQPRLTNEQGHGVNKYGFEIWEKSVSLHDLLNADLDIPTVRTNHTDDYWNRKIVILSDRKNSFCQLSAYEPFNIKVANRRIDRFGPKIFGYSGQITLGHCKQDFIMWSDEWDAGHYQQQWEHALLRIQTHKTSCLVSSIKVLVTGHVYMHTWGMYADGDSIHMIRQRFHGKSKKISPGKYPYFLKSCYQTISKKIPKKSKHTIFTITKQEAFAAYKELVKVNKAIKEKREFLNQIPLDWSNASTLDGDFVYMKED